MSTDQTTNLGLPFLMPAQAQKHVTVNESLIRLDALVQTAVKSRSVSVQPGSPADGQLWIVPSGKTGAEWGAFANWALAYYRDGAWEQIAPRAGWRVWVDDEAAFVAYNGAAWVADVLAGSINAGPLAGLRNAVMNGDFRIAQRGTSFGWGGSAGIVKTLDRWNAFMGASGDAVARIAPHVAVTRESACAYALELSVPVAATYQYLEHKIEDVRSYAGQPCTLSFDAWAAAPMTLAQVAVFQHFGSGGSATVTAGSASSVAVGATPARKTLSFTLPSVAGKTLGSGHHVWIAIYVNAGSAANAGVLRIADVQLEPGPAATPFEVRPLGLELFLCQRYFEKSFAQGTAPAQNVGVNTGDFYRVAVAAGANAQRGPRVEFTAPKRTGSPTVTLYNPAAANGEMRDITVGGDCSATTALVDSASGFILTTTGHASTAVGNRLGVHWTADAEL